MEQFVAADAMDILHTAQSIKPRNWIEFSRPPCIFEWDKAGRLFSAFRLSLSLLFTFRHWL